MYSKISTLLTTYMSRRLLPDNLHDGENGSQKSKSHTGVRNYSARFRNVNVHNDDIGVMTALGIPMDSLQIFITHCKVFTID